MDASLNGFLAIMEFPVSYCGFVSELEIFETLHQGFKFHAFCIGASINDVRFLGGRGGSENSDFSK